jgi:hypothetical protein
MDGGGIGLLDGEITTAWRRGESVFLSQPGSPEIEVGKGKDVALAVTARGAYVAWTSPTGIELRKPNDRVTQLIGSEGAFSTLIALPGNSVLAAWERAGSIELKLVQ